MLNLEGHHNVLGLKEVGISKRFGKGEGLLDDGLGDPDMMRRFHGIYIYNVCYVYIP